jgi:hypothetical protein
MAYRGTKVEVRMSPPVFKLGTKWLRPRKDKGEYSMNRRLGFLQRQSGRFERRKKSMAPVGNGILDRPSRCFAITRTGINKMATD